ncbi:MAG: alpha/beta fold hydrolase, partial [Bacteroidota bacterium]
MHYTTYRHDANVPWVVFVHGAGGSRLTWFKQVRDFRAQYNVLLVDLRGHGKSKTNGPVPSTRYTFQTIANDVIDVLDHLGIPAAHFVGVSMGTIIIRAIGEYHPGRVQGMVMA